MYGVKPSGQLGSIAELGGAPIIIVQDQEEKARITGYEALKNNILAAIQLADSIKSSLGPKGMDKVIVENDGNTTITNDGATILKKMPIEHECAKLFAQVSQSQDDQIGDGTTSVVILAGALLAQALKLLAKKIHPLKIAAGFDKACKIAVKYVEDYSCKIDISDDKYLTCAAKTSLSSKILSSDIDHIANICVQAIKSVVDKDRKDVNFDLIAVECKPGGTYKDSFIVNGIALDKDFSHSQMKNKIEDAKILLLNCPLEPPKPKTKHKFEIKNKESFAELAEKEQDYFVEMISKINESGANLLLCQWGFDDEANHMLYKNNLPAVRWISGKELEMISIVTNSAIVSRFDRLTPEKIGTAKCVRSISTGTEDKRMILIEGCPKSGAVTIILRGSNIVATHEAKRSVHDALCAIRNIIVDENICAGGGAIEIAVSTALYKYANTSEPTDQHALEAFAEALISIPNALIENSGYPSLQILSKIRFEQQKTNNYKLGFNCMDGLTIDMIENGIFESKSSKIHQLNLATQIAKMILKIDDVIVNNNNNTKN